jgi:hypothetical protein
VTRKNGNRHLAATVDLQACSSVGPILIVVGMHLSVLYNVMDNFVCCREQYLVCVLCTIMKSLAFVVIVFVSLSDLDELICGPSESCY